jgi:hypothetical protein
MALSEIKNFVSEHPWEAVGLGGGLAVLFFVVLRHLNGSSAAAVSALPPWQQLQMQKVAAGEAVGLAHQQELAATLPTRYATSSQTAQARIMAKMSDMANMLNEKLGMKQIAATIRATPTGTQSTGLAYQGLATQFADAQLQAEIAMYGGGSNMGYGGNAGYGYGSPYGAGFSTGYTPAYQSPAAYLGPSGAGGFLSGLGSLFGGFGGGGASSAGIDYGGGGIGVS